MNLTAAIRYNAARRYSPEVWRRIQRLVGATVDGAPGPETARAVADWQDRQPDLTPDGMVGPATMERLDEVGRHLPAAPRPSIPHGVWWDHTAGLTSAGAAALLHQCGVDQVCVMLDRVPEPPYQPRPHWKHSLGTLREIHAACAAEGLGVEATVWPLPRREHTRALVSELGPRLDALAPMRLQLDAEGNWEARDVQGYGSLRAAAEELAHDLEPYGLPLAVTSFPYHESFGRRPSFEGLVAAEIPQAYSRDAREDPDHPDHQVGGRFGPGEMQKLAAERARAVDPAPLELGLAAWDQVGLYATPHEAMRVAYEAAVDVGAQRVWWWSLKHLARNSYAADAIAAMTREARCS